MRIYKLLAIFSFVFYMPIQSESSLSIKELLVKIDKAPNQEKRVLINRLKLQLKSLNVKVRKKTMIEVKKSMNKMNHNNQHSHTKPHKCNHQPKFRHLHQENPHQHTPNEHNDKGRR